VPTPGTLPVNILFKLRIGFMRHAETRTRIVRFQVQRANHQTNAPVHLTIYGPALWQASLYNALNSQVPGLTFTYPPGIKKNKRAVVINYIRGYLTQAEFADVHLLRMLILNLFRFAY
jgi:hypothetical protein